jgi:hypothetical protein
MARGPVLAAEKKEELVSRYGAGETAKKLSEEYSISVATVRKYVSAKETKAPNKQDKLLKILTQAEKDLPGFLQMVKKSDITVVSEPTVSINDFKE